jgi:Na+-transporting NADH:ubiquinone oxidoreductase subunit A
MVHIKISKGLDIPMKGKPSGSPNDIIPSGQVAPLLTLPQIALSLKFFDNIKFRLLVKVGDVVKIGQPLRQKTYLIM